LLARPGTNAYNSYHRSGDGQTTSTLTIFALSAVIVVAFSLMALAYFNTMSTLTAARDATRPFMMQMVNHSLSILKNLDDSTTDADHLVHDARDLSSAAVPALQHALNQSASIVDRLERLARNPVLQLSLNSHPS
jgi:hypothetical protein